MRNYQEDVVLQHNKRTLRIWKVLLACILLIVGFVLYTWKSHNILENECNSRCQLYHSISRASFSIIVMLLGLLIIQLFPVKTWSLVVYLTLSSLVALMVCSFLFVSSSLLETCLVIVPFLSGLWFIYQSFIVVHLAHYFHSFLVSLRFGGFLSLFPGSCTIAPNILLQVYASAAVIVNILLMYGVTLLRDNFRILTDATGQHHTGVLFALDLSFYFDILMSLLSIQPQFNKGLITVNSIIAYQLLVFSQLLPNDHSQFRNFVHILTGFVTVVSACYMVMDRQHSSLIIYHMNQCHKNPLYFTVRDENDIDSCSGPRRFFHQCSQLAARILRMSPPDNTEETYELVSHTSESGNGNVTSSGGIGLGWSTLRNLYSSPNTSMESSEQEDLLEEGGGAEIDPDCMGDEDQPETSLLRSTGNSGAVGGTMVSNRMDRGSSMSDGLVGNANAGASSSGTGPLLGSSSSAKSKLSIANIPALNEANYNSINSPSGNGSIRSLDIENNYQESSGSAGSGCCGWCSAFCLAPVVKSSSGSRSVSYLSALTSVLMEKSVMFNLSLICLVCYATMLMTNWSAPDGTPLNIFRPSPSKADLNQSALVYGIMLVSVLALWVFYGLSLYGSYRLYYQYKRIRARLYRSRLVQHHPVRTSVIL